MTWGLTPQDIEQAREAACRQYVAAQEYHALWLYGHPREQESVIARSHRAALALVTRSLASEKCEPLARGEA